MPRGALVTGATGLLGRQVLKAFESAGWTGVGLGKTRAKPPLLSVDLTDRDAVSRILDEHKYEIHFYFEAGKGLMNGGLEGQQSSFTVSSFDAIRERPILTH